MPVNSLPEQPLDPTGDRQGPGDLLALGFGTTVAMWALGYVGHMPLTSLHPAAFVSAMLACVLLGGFVTGRYARRGLLGGLYVGAIVATLNLLILGSLLTDKASPGAELAPWAFLYIPGTYALLIALALIGAAVGRTLRVERDVNWKAAFAWVTVAATLLLLMAGGLVTGFRSGLAVPDWPNSFGVNMFLLPLRKMTGGTFYEHAHRLLGSLVGLTTLTLAIYLSIVDRRRALLATVWLTGLAVAVQGLLGGLRVTGKLTTATTGLTPDNNLSVVHGFFAHVVLGGLVAVAVQTTRLWRQGAIDQRPGASTDQFLATALVVLVLLQTLVGAFVRQFNMALLLHITLAVVVALLTLGVGMRAWGLNLKHAYLRRAGIALMLVLLVQVALGIIAVVFRTPPVDASPSAEALAAAAPVTELTRTTPAQALITTLHQTNAALLLAAALVTALGSWRLLREAPQPVFEPAGEDLPASA